MANRWFEPNICNAEKGLVKLQIKVTIGAVGAPTLTKGNFIASIARTAAGLYTITLEDKYVDLLGFSCVQMIAAAQDLTFDVVSEAVDSAKTINIRCKAAAVDTDPSSGSVLFIELTLKNSSVA